MKIGIIFKCLLFINFMSVLNADDITEYIQNVECTRNCLLSASKIYSSEITYLTGDLVKQIIAAGKIHQIEDCRLKKCHDVSQPGFLLRYAVKEYLVTCYSGAKSFGWASEWHLQFFQEVEVVLKNSSQCVNEVMACDKLESILQCLQFLERFCPEGPNKIMVPFWDYHCNMANSTVISVPSISLHLTDNVSTTPTLISSHPISIDSYKKEVENAVELLYTADHFHYFFTDRDGTLKSYSCSYPSSIQPAYSGVIQAQFARRCAQTCCILTTAPLMHIGVLDVSTIPPGYYYFGASAGREWFVDPTNKFKDTSIPESVLEMLDTVFTKISHLLEIHEFRPFTWVGSGLQKHYGHLTIAHQDVYKSVSEVMSRRLYEEIKKIVDEIDPKGATLQLSSTDLDIKIYLKTKTDGQVFDKGDGLKMLCDKMKCDLKEGNVLVCGDSATDLPMLKECLKRNEEGVYTIWVTTNEELKEEVRALCASYNNNRIAFVSCPEVLLGAMAQATIREINITRARKISREIIS